MSIKDAGVMIYFLKPENQENNSDIKKEKEKTYK